MTAARRAERRLDDALALLAELAAAGDGVAATALELLRARLHRAGRDDTAALAEVHRIAATGRRREAVAIVAQRLAVVESASTELIARRLRRKLKRTAAVSVSETALGRVLINGRMSRGWNVRLPPYSGRVASLLKEAAMCHERTLRALPSRNKDLLDLGERKGPRAAKPEILVFPLPCAARVAQDFAAADRRRQIKAKSIAVESRSS
jgi:hypothetical protein